MADIDFYLASTSPRRKQLLQQIGYSFTTIEIAAHEYPKKEEPPLSYVRRLSLEKAQLGLSKRTSKHPVLGADTIIVCDDKVLEKPSDRQDAYRMLTLLSGRAHQVITAISFCNERTYLTEHVTTTVWFKPLTELEIETYWQTGEPIGKAGSYAIQGYAGRFVTRIEGDFYAVMGLPLYQTDALFNEFQQRQADVL